MSVWRRATRLLKSKINSNKKRDPLDVLHKDIQLMDEKVRELKSNTLQLEKSKVQVENRIRDLDTHMNRYQSEAKKALRMGNEQLATMALQNKKSAYETQQQLRGRVEVLVKRIEEFNRLKEEMVNRIMILKIKKDEMMLTRSAAEAELAAEEMRMGMELDGQLESSEDAIERFDQEMKHLQAKVDATREIEQSNNNIPLPGDKRESLPSDLTLELEQLKRDLKKS